jgi:hypothetical protein
MQLIARIAKKVRELAGALAPDLNADLLRYLGYADIEARLIEWPGEGRYRFPRAYASVIVPRRSAIEWLSLRPIVSGGSSDEGGPATAWYLYCAVPGIPPRRVKLEAVRLKQYPIFGAARGIRWKGNDAGTGLIARLAADSELTRQLLPHSHQPKITVHEDTWLISTLAFGHSGGPKAVYERHWPVPEASRIVGRLPSFERIAHHLRAV